MVACDNCDRIKPCLRDAKTKKSLQFKIVVKISSILKEEKAFQKWIDHDYGGYFFITIFKKLSKNFKISWNRRGT